MQTQHEIRRLEVPRFSLAERDRRWARVRELMATDGIDVIVALPATGAWDHMAAAVRYLTTMGGNNTPIAAVFPREGDVTAVTPPVPAPEHWLGFQDWVTDIRPSFFSMTDAVVDRLKELDVGRGMIGLAGLADLPRLPEGIVAVGSHRRIVDALPEARVVNAQPLLEAARFVKSDEEVDFLRRSTLAVERAIDVLVSEARPGVPEATVYARMVAAEVEAGGELPTLILWSAGNPQPARNAFMPTWRPLAAGDLISTEIEGNYAGYRGQYTVQAFLGPVPDDYAAMFELQQRAVAATCERLRVGSTLGELIGVAEATAEGSPYRCQIILHGRGLGDDPPMTIFGTQFGGQDERMKAWRMVANSVVIVKPLVMTPDWSRWVCWGDSVLVTEAGAQRLGTKPPELYALAG